VSRFLLPSIFSLLAATLLLSCGEDKAAPATGNPGSGAAAAATNPVAPTTTEEQKKQVEETEKNFSKFFYTSDEEAETLLTSTIASKASKVFKHCCTKEEFKFEIELKLNKDKTFNFKFIPLAAKYETLELSGTWKVDGLGVTLEKLGSLALAADVATKADVVSLTFTDALGKYDLTQHKGLILGMEQFLFLPL